MQECSQHPTTLEPSGCKRSHTASQDQFSHCANSPNESDNALAKSDDLHQDHGVPYDNSRQVYNCSFNNSGSSCCTSNTLSAAVESLTIMEKKNTLQQVEPGQSWQAKFSNFIINLPAIFTDKIFGPRTNSDPSKNCERTTCNNNSRIDKILPAPKNTSKSSSGDESNKKSVKPLVSSLTDHGYRKNIGMENVFLEGSSQIDLCYSKTSQSVREDLPCERSICNSVKSTTTNSKKVTDKCGQKSRDDIITRVEESRNHLDDIHPYERCSKCEASDQTSSSISGGKKCGQTFPLFSSWPAILTKKLFGLQKEKKVLQCCVIGSETKLTKKINEVVDSSEIVSDVRSPPAAKKGRLMLKKYTILQTPEAVEETLCFDILAAEKLNATRTKLQTEKCNMKITSANRRKLQTIQERDEVLKKCSKTSRSHRSNRCVKSKGQVSKSSSRKMQQLQQEQTVSTEHTVLSSFISKLVDRYRDNKDICKEKKCHRNTGSGPSETERVSDERKCASKQNTKTISRKYATTSIHKHRNKLIKSSRYIGKNSRRHEPAVSCSSDESLDCCSLAFTNVENRTQSTISIDFSSGRIRGLREGSTQTYLFKNNIDNVEDPGKVTRINMIQDRLSRLTDKSSSSCESSKAKSFLKSEVSLVIIKNYRRSSKELGCVVSDCKKTEPESYVREKYCKKILSPKKIACRVNSRDGTEYNNGEIILQHGKTIEEGACAQRQPETVKRGSENCDPLKKSKSCKPENYGNNDLSITRMKRRSKGRYPFKLLPAVQAGACERTIVKENDILNSTKDKRSRVFVRGTRRMFVIVGKNISIKMFHNRRTCTDDLPKVADSQIRKCSKKRRPDQELLHAQTMMDENVQRANNYSPSRQKIYQNNMDDVDRSSESQLDSIECYSNSRFQEVSSRLDRNGNSNLQKQTENEVRIRIDVEECASKLRKDDMCRKPPAAGISEGEDMPEVEHYAETVVSSLWRKAKRECEITVCGDKTCLYKTLSKSKPEVALGILNEDKFCRSQLSLTMSDNSSSKINDCSNFCSAKKRNDSSNEPSNKTAGKNNRQLLKIHSQKSEQSDVAHMKIDIAEKRNRWVTSPGKYLEVRKPESRNIINSYYPQRKSLVRSKLRASEDEHAEVKEGKIQQDCNASEKSITCRSRKPFHRIENMRQVDCTANVVIKDIKSKKRTAPGKENRIIDNETRNSEDESHFNDTKNYLVQNVVTNESNLSNSFIEDSVNIFTPSARESKIPKKSMPLAKNKTSERVSGSIRKASESSSTKLNENSSTSLLKKGNNETTSGTIYAKGTIKEIVRIAKNSESESPNSRLTRTIDTCDSKGSVKHKELEAPAYNFYTKNREARNSQIEISNIEKPNGAVDKGTAGWIAKERKGSKSSKSRSVQRKGEQREDDKSRNSGAAGKETKDNKQTEGNQSQSETGSKKNEKDKKPRPPKLQSQIDSEIDVRNSTQGCVTMNADLFASALMDGKNNIKSYRDLQSPVEENSNSNRISASKNEGLRKSRTATTQSKSKVSNSFQSNKTSAKKTFGKSKNDKNSKNFQEITGDITENVNFANKDRTENISTYPEIVSVGNSNKGPAVNKVDLTEHSLGIQVNNTEPSKYTICKKSDICTNNSQPQSSTKDLNQLKSFEVEYLPVNQSDLKKNSIALTDCNSEGSCTARTPENAIWQRKSSDEKSPFRNSRKETNDKRFSLKLRMSSCHRKNESPTASSRTSSDSERSYRSSMSGIMSVQVRQK